MTQKITRSTITQDGETHQEPFLEVSFASTLAVRNWLAAQTTSFESNWEVQCMTGGTGKGCAISITPKNQPENQKDIPNHQ